MAFTIDKILMTLLVGIVMSLSVLSLLFLFARSKFRVPVIDRVFRFLMWEVPERESGAQSEPGRDIRESTFAGMLMIAACFGLGIATENASDNFSRGGLFGAVRSLAGVEDDQGLRIDSFLKVAKVEMESGRPNNRSAVG